MVCPNCGTPVADTANFCSKCGTRISREIPPQPQAHTHCNYTMYEVFDSTKSVSSKLNGLLDRVLSTPDSPTTLNRFTLTDQSIITDFGEFSYDRMTVLAPNSINRNMFGEGFSAGMVCTTIDGKEYHLHILSQDALRFYSAAINANKKIPQNTKRQQLLCVCMHFLYLLNLKVLLEKLPVTFEGEISKEAERAHFESLYSGKYSSTEEWEKNAPKASPPTPGKEPFDEFITCNHQVTVNDDAYLSLENQAIVDAYGMVQAELNQFLKDNNPIPNAGYNRSAFTLMGIVNQMTDADTDTTAAIIEFNRLEKEKQERELREREERQQRYKEEREYRATKQDYYWTSECMQRKNMRNGKYKVFRKCEGCHLAPFCSRYR